MAGASLTGLLGAYNNLDEPQPNINKRSTILSLVIVFMVIKWIAVSLRFYVRFFVVYSPGWDDFSLVLVLASTTLGSIMLCALTNVGLGEHFILLGIDNMNNYLFRFWIANASYTMSTSLIKISLVFQFLRIYRTPGLMRSLSLWLMVLLCLFGGAFSFTAWFPCFPVRMYWDLLAPEAGARCYCFGSRDSAIFFHTYEAHSVLNMVLDVVVFSIPAFAWWHKDTVPQARKGLLALLAMGSCVLMLAMWRFQSILEHRATTSPTFDPSWYVPIITVLSTLEVEIATVCASAPVFWPVLRAKVAEMIMVTREIEIRHEERQPDEFELSHNTEDSRSLASSCASQGFETLLDRITAAEAGTGKKGGGSAVFGSGGGSGDCDDGIDGHGAKGQVPSGTRTSNKNKHYQNSFVRQLVNPFDKEKQLAIVRVVSGTDEVKSAGFWARLFPRK